MTYHSRCEVYPVINRHNDYMCDCLEVIADFLGSFLGATAITGWLTTVGYFTVMYWGA